MFIDDTNYWEAEEKLFRKLMPQDRVLSSADEACEVVNTVLSKKIKVERKFWLLMFALTDREIMRPDPRRIFERIMESNVMTRVDKATLCELIMKEAGPFKAEYVLSPEQLKERDEKIRERVIKATEEFKSKTPDYLTRLFEEFSGSLDNLVAHAFGLPQLTLETYSLPYFRLFPRILPRYAMRWLCRFGEADPAELISQYGLRRMQGNGEDWRPFFLGAMDLLREFKDDLDDSLIDKVLRKGKRFPHIEVRKAVYRLGLELRGGNFLKEGLKDQSIAVRKTVQKLRESH